MAGAGAGAGAGAVIFTGVKPRSKSHQRQEQQLFAGLDSSSATPVEALPLLLNSSSSGKNKNLSSVSSSSSTTPRAGVIRAKKWSGEDDDDPEAIRVWRSSRNGSILPAAAPSPLRSGNVGTAPRSCRPRFCEEEQSSVDFAASMEDWGSLHASAGSGIDKTIYQNLVEMLPLMESFMEQKGNKRPFTRHASMVYTPAPTRETPVKKVGESPMKLKKNKQQRAGNGKVDLKEEGPVWEEQENILRRVEQEECIQQQQQPQPQQEMSEALSIIEKLNREELMQLQDQIDNLKQQLWEKDSMLKTVRSYEMAELANQEQIAELKSRVDELQKHLWEKERVAHTAQALLLEKQQKYGNVESLLGRAQQELMRKNEAEAMMREELSELRVQMSAYQFQAELHKAKLGSEEEDEAPREDEGYSSEAQADELIATPEESKTVEAARRMYLGAVIAARTKPGAESMALAAESRKRLEAFLRHPFFRGAAAASLPLI